MTEAWTIGTYRTDTMTGKTPKILTLTQMNVAAGAFLFQSEGANYRVALGKTFYATALYRVGNYEGGTNGTVVEPVITADNTALTTNPITVFNSIAIAMATPPAYPPFSIYFTIGSQRYIGVLSAQNNNYFQLVIVGYEA